MTKLRKPRHKTKKLPERREPPTPETILRRWDDAGRTFQERLQELKKEENLTLEDFAAKIGAPKHSTPGTWLGGKGLPSVEYLDSIASAFNVATDWLLGVKDAPKYRGQQRTSAALEQELEGYLVRKVADRVMTSLPEITADQLQVDVAGFLEDAVTRESDGLQKWASWFVTKEKIRTALERMEQMRWEHDEDTFRDTFGDTDVEHIVSALERVPPAREPFVKLRSTFAIDPDR